MHNNVSLNGRARALGVAMMLLCFAIAGGKLVSGVAPLIDPVFSTLKIYCKADGCWPETDPLLLAPKRSLRAGALSDAQVAQLAETIETPRARIILFAA